MNNYTADELAELREHYASLQDKPSYDAFLRHGHALLKRIGADPYHVRMALTKGYSMMEFGNRAAYQHREVDGQVEIGLLIRMADLGQVDERHKRSVHNFKPVGGMSFIHSLGADWNAIPQVLLDLNEVAMREEYVRIKDTTLVEQRRGSGTDNEALRFAIVHGLLINELPGPLGLIMVNITWNSRDWKGPSQDKSNHGYVKEGNTPMESWNFDLDNPRNPPGQVLGFVQHTSPPKLEGNNNLVIYHSAGKVVGFYGKGRFLKDKPRASDGYEYNVIGDRSLSLVLPNKLDDIKTKGYMEVKQRMGQNGFIYLEQPETALKMIDEALDLNPGESVKLNALRTWVASQQEGYERTSKRSETMNIPLNRIFYGPPGTGKTYHTIGAAVQVCDPEYHAANKDDDAALRQRFNELLIKDQDDPAWQIAFCTFHQSFSYEDFVEGIKPVLSEEGKSELSYHVRAGILKVMAERATVSAGGTATRTTGQLGLSPDEFTRADFYKMSLGAKYDREDDDIYRNCIRNKVIAIGYMDQHDLTGKTEREINELPLREGQVPSSSNQMNYFCNHLKQGDYVIITNGNHFVRAIGRVKGAYRYAPEGDIRYPHLRDVEWLVKDANIPYEDLYTKKFVQRTIYKLFKEDLKRDFFVRGAAAPDTATPRRNYVLIIDEINRGNVAGIFGELITLIEENKRKGRPEALEVTLPYSQEPFSIPDNLYIIGTMNTADRSVEALDAALRRRFNFVPMMPDTTGLKPLQNTSIDLKALLNKLNARLVQLLDEDHQIGHSHFWDLHLESDPVAALRRVFKDKIIPQLEEYFHRDRSKLRLVLGERFVERLEPDDEVFLGDADDLSVESRPTYRITAAATWDENAFVSIHG